VKVRSVYNRLLQDSSGCVTLCQFGPGYIMLSGEAMLVHDMTRYVMLGLIISCYFNMGHVSSV